MGAPAPPNPEVIAFQTEVRPIIGEYCVGCHNPRTHKADLDLTSFDDAAKAAKSIEVWHGVA